MHIEFKPTRRCGGVTIIGDEETIYLIDRLLTHHALNSQCCYDNGACMALSQYFDQRFKKGHIVDWITLVVGITVLRTSLGFNCSRRDRALIFALEYELQKALCSALKAPSKTVDDVLDSLRGLDDLILKDDWYSILTYLYLLKTAKCRKKELLSLLQHINPIYSRTDKGTADKFKHLSLVDLERPYGSKFEYEL